jgi:hypothetical protein
MSIVLDPAEAAKADFVAGVTAAYAAAGYIDSEGRRDDAALAEAVFTAVEPAKVDGLTKREADAATRGTIIATLFPSLPKTADEWNAQPDPALAVKVYGEIRRIVWDLLKMDKSGKVQQLVGLRHPGFVLCRTKVGADHTDAAYITDDQGCITTDFVTPLNASIVRANKTMGRNMAMIVDRKPDLATKWERLYKNAVKKGLEAGSVPLDMSLEAARNNGTPGGDDEPAE